MRDHEEGALIAAGQAARGDLLVAGVFLPFGADLTEGGGEAA